MKSSSLLQLSPPPSPSQIYLRWFVGIVLVLAASMAVLAPGYASAALRVGCARSSSAPTLEGTLNLNTATAQQLDLLPGVGPSTADKIIAFRDRHAFRSVQQLLKIKGIGRKTLDRLRPYLTVEGESTLRVVDPG